MRVSWCLYEVRGQLVGNSSVLPLCGFWGSKSDCQGMVKGTLATEQPQLFYCITNKPATGYRFVGTGFCMNTFYFFLRGTISWGTLAFSKATRLFQFHHKCPSILISPSPMPIYVHSLQGVKSHTTMVLICIPLIGRVSLFSKSILVTGSKYPGDKLSTEGH